MTFWPRTMTPAAGPTTWLGQSGVVLTVAGRLLSRPGRPTARSALPVGVQRSGAIRLERDPADVGVVGSR